MSVSQQRIPDKQLPDDKARMHAGSKATGPLKMMAARSLAPLPPKVLAHVLYNLQFDEDEAVAKAAAKGLEDLPDKIVIGFAADESLHPYLLDWLARHRRDQDLFEKIALNKAAHDSTIEYLAMRGSEAIVDVVSTNQTRMTRHPGIIEAIYANPNTRLATRVRVIEWAQREEVVCEGVPELTAEAIRKSKEPPSEEEIEAAAAQIPEELVTEADEDEEADEWLPDIEEEEDEQRLSMYASIQRMTVAEKAACARMGNKEARNLLVRDGNKVVAAAAIRNPRVTEQEVVAYAGSRTVNGEVVRLISLERSWLRLYQVKLSLVNNPTCPQATALRLLQHLRETDVRTIAKSKNIPNVVQVNARRMLAQKAAGRRGAR